MPLWSGRTIDEKNGRFGNSDDRLSVKMRGKKIDERERIREKVSRQSPIALFTLD